MASIFRLSLCLFTIAELVGGQQNDIVTKNSNSNSTQDRSEGRKEEAVNETHFIDRQCRILADSRTADGVRKKISEEHVKLLEYQLKFKGYSNDTDPLIVNVTKHHKPNVWTRVSDHHGQTLLSLPFNYDVLSLMTLTMGTDTMVVELEDDPNGCFGILREDQKFDLIRRLLMRDLKLEGGSNASSDILGHQKICHQVVRNHSGYAQFTYNCCSVDGFTLKEKCEMNDPNLWLQLLDILQAVVRVALILFGPLMLLPSVDKFVNQQFAYVVSLKEPLKKKIAICKEDESQNFNSKRKINFSNKTFDDIPKFEESLNKLSENEGLLIQQGEFEAEIWDYHITVDYNRLLKENEMPVCFSKAFINNLFKCQLRDTEAFVTCCRETLCPLCKIRWIDIWRFVGLGLFALLIPTPFYIRLLAFYFFEYDEVVSRETIAENLHLNINFKSSLLYYLQPHHPMYLAVYVISFLLIIICIYNSESRVAKKTYSYNMIVKLLRDLKRISLSEVLTMAISNIIWPFEKFGLFGIFVAFVYWPVVLPFTCLISSFYCLPTVYLAFRLWFLPIDAFFHQVLETLKERSKGGVEKCQQLFWIKNIWKLFIEKDNSKSSQDSEKPNETDRNSNLRRSAVMSILPDYKARDKIGSMDQYAEESTNASGEKSGKTNEVGDNQIEYRQMFESVLITVFGIVGMCSVLILANETIGFLVEVAIFTTMGVIVNAGGVLKYVALVVLVVVYIYDSFNNVGKKYFKLCKALFNIVKNKVKGLEEIINQPSSIQENHGFKSQELSEQGEHEAPDDVDSEFSRHWFINDLVLFVDKDDVPRIPKKLFEEVCAIEVEGVPGPVYLGFCDAVRQFAKMAVFVFFIFLAILAFGEVSGLSATNQTIAALAGGMLPLLLKTFMNTPKPDIDLETVSFKSKLDEVVSNFNQYWPMYDFSFKRKPTEGVNVDEGNAIKQPPTMMYAMPGMAFSSSRGPSGRKSGRHLEKLLRKTYTNRKDVDILIKLPKDFDGNLSALRNKGNEVADTNEQVTIQIPQDQN